VVVLADLLLVEVIILDVGIKKKNNKERGLSLDSCWEGVWGAPMCIKGREQKLCKNKNENIRAGKYGRSQVQKKIIIAKAPRRGRMIILNPPPPSLGARAR
jgi:hypothetical protein